MFRVTACADLWYNLLNAAGMIGGKCRRCPENAKMRGRNPMKSEKEIRYERGEHGSQNVQ